MKYLSLLFILFFTFSAHATTFTVTRTDDRNVACNSGDCSLREAVNAANVNADSDSINFSLPSLPTNITLTIGELLITNNLMIDGIGAEFLTVSRSDAAGTPKFRIFNIGSGATVSMSGLAIRGGRIYTEQFSADHLGGGILNAGTLNLSNVTITNNIAGEVTIGFHRGNEGYGGGIHNSGNLSIANSLIIANRATGNVGAEGGGVFSSGNLTITNTSISGNSAQSSGSGINNNGSTFGGGIYGGNVIITNSLISNNSIGSGIATSQGGGIFAGNLTLTNSTVSGNRSTSTSGQGGGIFVTTSAVIKSSTIAQNLATSAGGGITATAANITNTIIADNTLTELNSPSPSKDVQGSVISGGNNLIGNTTGSSGWIASDILNQNAKLAALADNGGPTLTHALLSGSPAINAGNNADAPATDQRGFARIVGGIIDIGSFESENPCLFTIDPTNQSVSNSGGNITVNVSGATGCSRTATSNVDWIIVTSGNSGNANGTVSLTVQSNTGAARTGTVTIAGQTFTVNQSSGCTYALSPTGTNISGNSTTGSFNIISGSGCNYTASSNDSFITITSGSSGSGNGTVSYSVDFNSGNARTGTITAGGQMFTVNQANGCSFNLSPVSQNFSASGGAGSFTLTTQPGCAFTSVSNDDFITIDSGASGMGTQTINFFVQSNTSATRTGTITVGNQTFTINQAAGKSRKRIRFI
jgi:CSLREA domain-containing protein